MPEGATALVVAIGSLVVSVITTLRHSRCTELICSDCCIIRRAVEETPLTERGINET